MPQTASWPYRWLCEIHEGLIWSNRDRRTLLDKMLSLLGIVAIKIPSTLWAMRSTPLAKLAKGLYDQNNHRSSRVKSNAVAFAPYVPLGPRKRGRPKALRRQGPAQHLLSDPKTMQSATSPVYGEDNVTIQYRVSDLLWRALRLLVPFRRRSPLPRGSCLLMCTDISLEPSRSFVSMDAFKIEHSFKQAVHRIGSFAYHFWMRDMKPLRRGAVPVSCIRVARLPQCHQTKDPGLSRLHSSLASSVRACFTTWQSPSILVWSSFGSWLRTIRPGVPPSELVVASALRQAFPEFLLNNAESNFHSRKFIVERQDPDELGCFRLAT